MNAGGQGGAAGGSGGAATGGASAAPAFSADFEDGVVGQGPPAPFTNTGKVDDSKSFSGKKSIRIESSSGKTMFSLPVSKYIAPNRKTAYARFMVWMENLPGAVPSEPGHWDLIKFNAMFRGGGYNVNGFLSWGGFAEKTHKLHMFGDDTAGKGRQDCTKTSPLLLPTKTWTCIELKVDENDIVNYGVSMDGEEIQPFSFIYEGAASNCVPGWNIMEGVWYLPEVTSMSFGFEHVWTQMKPVTVWFDDIAISSKPIGCPKK